MKKSLILLVSAFHVFSVWAGVGTRFREAIHSIDLTQPLATELKKINDDEFKQLKNPYRYLPELALFPSGYMNHWNQEFMQNLTQDDLAKLYQDILKDAPASLKLKSGAQCTYNSDKPNFSLTLQGKYTKGEDKHNPNTFAMFIPRQLQAYAETDEGVLVLLNSENTISAYEFFNRKIFVDLSREQLAVLANLYDISTSTNNGKIAHIHPGWYEVYNSIPKEVINFMFKIESRDSSDITVVPLTSCEQDEHSKEASALGRHGKSWNPKEQTAKVAKTE